MGYNINQQYLQSEIKYQPTVSPGWDTISINCISRVRYNINQLYLQSEIKYQSTVSPEWDKISINSISRVGYNINVQYHLIEIQYRLQYSHKKTGIISINGIAITKEAYKSNSIVYNKSGSHLLKLP